MVSGNIWRANKIVEINEDGHDFITYTTDGGKVLATCMSGYDSDCPGSTITNEVNTSTPVLIHLTKQYNNSLVVKDNSTGLVANNNAITLRNYVTKQTLTSSDYSISYNSNGDILFTFLGAYAGKDLFLEITYSHQTGTPSLPSGYKVFETHTLGYTQWTVYFYDVKGRLKATQSPNDVVCGTQPQNIYGVVTPPTPTGFGCADNSVGTINLRSVNTSTTDSVFNVFSITPKPNFNFFSSLKTYTNSSAFKFQSNASLAPLDSLTIPFVTLPDSFIVHVTSDTLNNPQIDTVTVRHTDTIPNLYTGTIKIKGKYYPTVVTAARSVISYTNNLVDFEYDILLDGANTRVVDRTIGEPTIVLDSAALINAREIAVTATNLRITLSGFGNGPFSSFSPCDMNMYVPKHIAQLIQNINANISFPLQFFGTFSTPPQTATFSRQFYYNEFDHLIGTWSRDENKTNYLYDQAEDKLMFSQNEKQRTTNGRFTYIVYDDRGRPVETGEHDQTITDPNNSYIYWFQTYDDYKTNGNTSGNVSTAYHASINQPLPATTRFTERTFVSYDVPDANNPASSNYPQKYTHGKISSTRNSNGVTYYSYNELGRIMFSVNDITGLGVKTMEYAYDFRGKLLNTIYQRGHSDVFMHMYTYDADERLLLSSFRRGTTSSTTTYPISRNNYYTHGALKRKVLGRNLQGLDYIYTLRGTLKSINNPLVLGFPSVDPGADGLSNSMPYDMFAFALEYYPGDYERANSPLSYNKNTSAYNMLNISYTGLIHAQRWGYNLPPGTNPSPLISGPLMYEYDYDELYRLTGAQFCNYTGVTSSNSNFLADLSVTALGSNKLSNITYDRNGNIKTLKRYAELTSGSVLMDDLTYNYSSTIKNRLNSVTDANTTNYSLSAEVDFPNQTSSTNYQTNAIGELTVNAQDNQKYEYDHTGLTTKIKKNSNSNSIVAFAYNNNNLRQSKTTYDASGTAIERTWYVYDAAGALIAVYKEDLVGSGGIYLIELALYDEGRAGMYDETVGKATFELKDQVGNVRMVIEDNGNYAPSMRQYTDYYPHGSPIPGRSYVSGIPYRFGIQSQEKDPESSLTNFDERQIDPRIGRWLTTDPNEQHHSPYLSMSNNPINFIDPDGGEDGSDYNPDCGMSWTEWMARTNNPDVFYKSESDYDYTKRNGAFGGSIDASGNFTSNNTWIYEANQSWLNSNSWATYRCVDGQIVDMTIYTHPLMPAYAENRRKGNVEEQGFWSKLDDAIGSGLFGSKSNYRAIKTNSGDDNPYMFTRAELNNAANIELEALSYFIPVGELFQGIKWLSNARFLSKIEGAAQSTGTIGHATLSKLIGLRYALDPRVQKVTLDLGLKRLTGNALIKNGPRPDVGVLFKNGAVKVFEVASKSQMTNSALQQLYNKNLNAFAKYGIENYSIKVIDWLKIFH